MNDYTEFLRDKTAMKRNDGIAIDPSELHPVLFGFQRSLTMWALRKGRAGIFADTGLGKTLMQCEWARVVTEKTGHNVLIVAPLSVAQQTIDQAKMHLSLEVAYSRDGQPKGPITITNYEMLDHFNPDDYIGIVLDESSILKSIAGKTREKLIDMFRLTPFRLACTATPSPNDIAEIANHAEFLGLMTRTEMLAQYFVHDDEGWRLKGHAKDPFYRWMASWGMSIRRPSDLGYSDEGYDLPPLTIEPIIIDAEYQPEDRLFFTGLSGITDRSAVRKQTMIPKVSALADIVNADSDQWIIWCGLNEEASLIAKATGGTNVQGSDSIEYKMESLRKFIAGEIRVLVTKAKIAGFGMNFQNCHKMAFLGMNDSWEMYYQCIRRCYRFGQQHPVYVAIMITEPERPILSNVKAKEKEAQIMSEELIKNVQSYEKDEIEGMDAYQFEYAEGEASGDGWKAMLGDSCERMKDIPDNHIDMSVFSPPFESLYTYTPTERDLGNSRNRDEFLSHFRFIVTDLLRIMKPGRVAAVHVADIPAMLVRDGYIGLKDFSGDVIRLFIDCGWTFDSRIPIDKNQQAQSIRTHSKALTMSQLEKDRTWNRPALPDYILKFRKPGTNAVNVNDKGVTRDEWIELANPTWPGNDDRAADAGAFATWYGIDESDTLNYRGARHSDDERHICPLQLGTIERCIRLWTNPGELVFTPFAGVFSEIFTAVKLGRRGLGIELKPEYFRQGVKNMRGYEQEKTQVSIDFE